MTRLPWWISPLVLLAIILLIGMFQGTATYVILLSEMTRARVQSISFFAGCFLASAWGVRKIWNSLADEFPRLPQFSNGRAVGLVALWGLLFLLGFTMVSAARPLITSESAAPRTPSEVSKESDRIKEREGQLRRDHLENLSLLLRHYANGHGGKFPVDDKVPEIPAEFWQLPGPARMHYRYAKGQTVSGAVAPLAYEPGIFGEHRLVLMTDGSIRKLGFDEPGAMLTGGDK